MKRALTIVAFVLVAVVATAAARPSSIFGLFQQLNGHPARWVMPDGGQSYMAGAGMQCVPLAGAPNGGPFLVIPEMPMNLCVRPQPNLVPWDGGCNGSISDPNFGTPVGAWVPQYVTPAAGAQYICGVSDAGTFQASVWGEY